MAIYDAFISYSHAKDKPIASALQSVIQKLGKPWYRRRALRVFRDDTSLSASPGLWPTIEQALGQSRYFLLIASPEAAASKWVNKEVAHWLNHNTIDTLLIGATGGGLCWDEATGDFAARDNMPLPPVLAGQFVTEPKWLDLRAYRDGADKGDAKFTELAADFAAAIRGMPKEDLLSQEVRQQRRALALAWSAAASLLVLAGAAGWELRAALKAEREATEQKQTAEQQRRVAETETARAERNFGAAKSTVDAVVLELVQGLQDIEGMRAETARRLLERAETAVGQLATRTENDPQILYSQASMFTQFSDVYFRLGATQIAGDYARKATSIFRDLSVKDPANMQLRRDEAASLDRVADALKYQGDVNGSLAAYRDGLNIRRALASQYPEKATQLRSDLSLNLGRIGQSLVLDGDFTGAVSAQREALDIRRDLSVQHPDNAQLRRAVSVSLNRFGDALALQGNVIAALDADRESLDIVRGLVANDPENTGWQSDLVSNLTSLGFVLLMQGDLQGALVAHRESLDITRTLAAKDPGNTKWLRAMSSSLTNLGNVLGVQGNLADAVVAHRESLHIARELVAKDPGNMQWQTDLVSSLNGLALAGDDPGGRWSEALDILNRLKTENRLPPAQQRQITTIEASLAKLGRTEHSWLMKFHFGEMTTARPIPPPRFPSTTVQQIQGRYDGFNTVNQMPGEHQFSLTFVQSENNITATYQSALGGRGKGTGTIKGNVVDGMSLQSEISKCPGSYAASLVFVDDTVNWTYTGQDCGGPVQGHGTARKTNP